MDPLAPPPPKPAYYDAEAGAWIVSRYADVFAALREPVFEQERDQAEASNYSGDVRTRILEALPPTRVAELSEAIENASAKAVDAPPTDGPFDLVRQLIVPFCRDLAAVMIRDGAAHRRRLLRLARWRDRDAPALLSKIANAELEFFFRKRPGDKSAFIGTTETLPGFVANAWAALLRHPDELARLRAQPELASGAVEELLRYAGLVHSLVRTASANVDFAGVRIAAGDRVILKLQSANRDPEQFPCPDRLDIARGAFSHLGLGHGRHACAGAFLLRTATTAITRRFAESFAGARIDGEIEWRWGATLVSAAAIPVILQRR